MASTLDGRSYAVGWWCIELAVTVVESLIFVLIMRISVTRGALLSLLANGFSAAVGLCWQISSSVLTQRLDPVVDTWRGS